MAVGDLLRGYLIIDTSRVELITPGAPYANYSVSDGAHIAIYIAGDEFKRSIDYINITDDRLIHAPDNLYLDRFFVSSTRGCRRPAWLCALTRVHQRPIASRECGYASMDRRGV